jgi:hypothetical protein
MNKIIEEKLEDIIKRLSNIEKILQENKPWRPVEINRDIRELKQISAEWAKKLIKKKDQSK